MQTPSPVSRSLLERLYQKVTALAPVAGVSVVLLGGIWLLSYLLFPYFPESLQTIFGNIAEGEWEAGQARLKKLLDSFGVGTVIAFLVAAVLEVLLAPLPGQVLAVAAGYLYGFGYGLLLTLTGLTLGITIAMVLARLVGNQIVRRFIPAKVQQQFDDWMARGGLWNFFLLSLLPLLPHDVICFLGGVTRFPLWQLIVVCLLGRLPYITTLVFLGATAGWGEWIAYTLLGVGMVLMVVLWLFSEEVEAWALRILKRPTQQEQDLTATRS